MNNSKFLDIDILVNVENKAWIVDKNNPNVPIYKISKSDFNLIKSGIYRSQGNKVEFNGRVFWVPLDLLNILKIKCKVLNIDFSNIAISLQEFLNKEIVDDVDYTINMDVIDILDNKEDDIYIICSRQVKSNYASVIEEIEREFGKRKITIKGFYYISENFYNQNHDDIRFKKMRLLLQHLLGYRTDGNKFTDKQITRYDIIEYYDNEHDTLSVSVDMNGLLEIILSKTENGIRDVIKEDIKEFSPTLISNKVSDNKINRIESKKVILSLSNIIQKFESFKFINGSI